MPFSPRRTMNQDEIGNSIDASMIRDRLSATEKNVAAIQEAVENLSASVNRTLKGIDRLREQRTSDARPQYGMMAAIGGVAVTVVLAVVGIAGSGYVRDQNRVEEAVKKLSVDLNGRAAAQMQWQNEHEWEVRDTNARQSERLDANERIALLQEKHLRELITLSNAKDADMGILQQLERIRVNSKDP